jgi:hypothetical protein
MDTQGWSDIAYNLMACPHDYVYECRGKGVGSAANGTTQANKDWYAVCALVGKGDPQPPGLITALQYAARLCRDWGAGAASCGHRDLTATECPGDALYAQVQAGTFTTGGTSPTPSPTPPPKPTPTPTPKAPPFPLPSGHYFGPAEGPAESHSGYYSEADRKNLDVWQTRMIERGWSLAPYGADGYYGDVTANVARQFQAEKGLAVDGLIGTQTWATAWTAPIT